jgi:hypothetical protein
MAENPHASARLRPIMHAYLRELARVGCYGKGKAGVIRRFIENGITQAIEAGVITVKNVEDFGESVDEEDEEDA